jgi:hypothetical protein
MIVDSVAGESVLSSAVVRCNRLCPGLSGPSAAKLFPLSAPLPCPKWDRDNHLFAAMAQGSMPMES